MTAPRSIEPSRWTSEFDNLSEIRAVAGLAQKQQEALLPVQEEFQRLNKSRKANEDCRTLKRIVPIWFAEIGVRKWRDEAQRLGK